jgi:hypothetical protein
MQNTTSKFKWMEELDKQSLTQAVTALSMSEKVDLVEEVRASGDHHENNLRVVVVAQSQIIDELMQLATPTTRQPMSKQHSVPSAEHWNQVMQEDKLNFYECAMHFFATNDLLKVIEVLQDVRSVDPQKQKVIDNTSAALKSFWFKGHLHKQDLVEIAIKMKKS